MSIKKTIGIGTVIGLILTAIAFILLLKFSSLIIFAVALPRFTEGLAVDGGLNRWLAQALAVAFTAFMITGGYLIFNRAGSLSGRMMKMMLLGCLLIGGYSLTIYWLQCGRVETVQKNSQSWNTGQPTKFSRATVDRNTSFFNPLTGEPSVWYFRDDKNRLEFFTSGGVHPQYNQPLKPVDAETVKQLFAYLDSGRTEMIIGPEGAAPQIASSNATPANPPPADRTSKPAKPKQKSKSGPKKTEDTRPIHQVLRQQMSIELDHLVAFLCQAQNNR